MTKVKICGITRAEDAALAEELGADYLGFIFVRESPRYVTPEQAREILECGSASYRSGTPQRELRHRGDPERRLASPHSRTVGVFRNSPVDEVIAIAAYVGLDLVQLHGHETYALDLPTIKAFNVQDALPDTTTHADYILFDTGGGTGRTFDWSLLARYAGAQPFFLAGGITPDNVAEAIERTRPYAIDLASGVEERPGIKDHGKLRKLFERIKR